MKYLVIAAAILGVAFAAVPRVKRESSPDFYNLISNATTVLYDGGVNYGFNCEGRNFGYYADPNNNCQIFHVCMPYEDSEGLPQLRMWSFLCGVGSIFDQSQLVCNYPEASLPCGEAEGFYGINDYFHKEEEEFRSGVYGAYKKK